MKKIFFTFFFLLSFLNASITHNVSLLDSKNKCIFNDYYNKGGSFYYRYLTSSGTSRSTSSKKYSLTIINGYKFDDETNICSPEDWRILGMSIENYHFLNSLVGLLFGFVFMIFTIYLFVIVGGKR